MSGNPLITGVDHIVMLVADIEIGVATYQALLGRAPAWRAHGDGTQTALFTLQNVSLELMAPNGLGAAVDHVRNILAQQGEGLASLCFRVADIERIYRRLDRLALKPEPVGDGGSRDDLTGSVLAWKRTRAATAASHGVRLFFLQMADERPPSPVTGDGAVAGLDHVVIETCEPERAASLYGARLGLDMALDRSHPDWGRLMFFRCGDLVVEVVHRHGDESGRPDRLWGLGWRVRDLAAARARLIAAGIDVSDLRNGRKPGTRVASIRSATCGVPTLLIEPSTGPV